MKFRNVSLAIACCSLSLFPVSADVLIMKNGEKLEGTILREEGDNYVIEVQAASKIRDEKFVPRAEVLKIERVPEFEKAYAIVADLCPAPELLSVQGYEERINKLREFIEAFPKSPRSPVVEEMIKSLEEEMALIKGGAVKLGEEIISAEDYEVNAYGYDALIAEKRIRHSVTRRDFLGALRGFDSYETSLGTPEGYAGLSSLMVQVLETYRASIEESLAGLESRLAARASGLARMSPNDRAKSQRAIDDELLQAAERFLKEKSGQMKWITPHAYYKESLEEAQRQATAEAARLDQREPEPGVLLAELYRTAWEKLEAGTDEDKKLVLEDAEAKKLPEYYLAKLRGRAGLPKE
jgi:hypothetical protein